MTSQSMPYSEKAEIEPLLSVAIVVYRPDLDELTTTIDSLRTAIQTASLSSFRLLLIDNTPPTEGGIDAIKKIATHCGASLFTGHGNVGFGRAHNMALPFVGRYHLVLNPDVRLDPDSVRCALAFMDDHPDCGLLTPTAIWPDGTPQYLCKRYPSLLDLALRGFAPTWLKRLFDDRLARYEMRAEIRDEVLWDPPIASGCFMFLRGALFREIRGFDHRYFLYFEDFDLSLRVSRKLRTAYVPTVRIMHLGGHAAQKGIRHVWLFCRSAWTFFNAHGWKLG